MRTSCVITTFICEEIIHSDIDWVFFTRFLVGFFFFAESSKMLMMIRIMIKNSIYLIIYYYFSPVSECSDGIG